MKIEIRETDIATIAAFSRQIPELTDPHPAEEYARRLYGRKALLLMAYADGHPAGFKVGYDKYEDGSFYSWMGGVLPAYRRHHVARALADAQEAWALKSGFNCIVLKTRNRHKAMLIFALSNSFSIIEVEPREILAEYRILLKKQLQPTT